MISIDIGTLIALLYDTACCTTLSSVYADTTGPRRHKVRFIVQPVLVVKAASLETASEGRLHDTNRSAAELLSGNANANLKNQCHTEQKQARSSKHPSLHNGSTFLSMHECIIGTVPVLQQQ